MGITEEAITRAEILRDFYLDELSKELDSLNVETEDLPQLLHASDYLLRRIAFVEARLDILTEVMVSFTDLVRKDLGR